jgi:hypothetical protein
VAASALASGMITPVEAATIAAVVDSFVRAIEASDFGQVFTLRRGQPLQQLVAAGMWGAEPGGYLNLLLVIRGQISRASIAYTSYDCIAKSTERQRRFSQTNSRSAWQRRCCRRLDVRAIKKYTTVLG